MNNQRRERLKKAVELMEQAAMIIEEVRDEEQEALDNLPENLQESERAETMQNCIDILDEIRGELEDWTTELEDDVL